MGQPPTGEDSKPEVSRGFEAQHLSPAAGPRTNLLPLRPRVPVCEERELHPPFHMALASYVHVDLSLGNGGFSAGASGAS